MKIKFLLLFSVALSYASMAIAQRGIGTNNPSPSAALDVVSDSKGVLIPRLTSAQRVAISVPAEGLRVYDLTTKGFWFFDGTSWVEEGLGDNLGNHTATTNLNMNSRDVNFTTGNQNMPSGNISFGNTTRQMLNLWNTSFGIGVQGSAQYFRTNNNFAWYRGGTHSNTLFDPGTGGESLMVLTEQGRLGIGTVVPTNRLTIGNNIDHDSGYDYSNAQMTLFDPNNNGGNTPNGTRDILNLVREGIAGEAFGNKATFALGRYENNGLSSRTQLDIKLNEGAFTTDVTAMTLRSNGNVGIGITAPTQTLDVNGQARVRTIPSGAVSDVVVTSDASGNLRQRTAAQIVAAGGGGANGDAWGVSGEDQSSNVSRAGNITINNENKTAITLQTPNNASANGIAFQNSGGAYSWNIFREDAGSADANLVFSGGTAIGDINALPERLRIQQNGNTAIGGHTPSSKLDIQTSARSGVHATGRPLYVTHNMNEAANGIEFRHSNGTQGLGFGWNSIYGAGSSADNNVNLMPKGTGGVGIGTTAPTAKLDVVGTGLFRSGNGAGGFIASQIDFGFGGGPNYRHSIRTRHNAGGTNENAIDFFVWDQTSDALTDLGTAHVMSLDGTAGGRVGINTTSPSQALDVVGRTQTTNFTMTNGATNGYVLQSNATGNAAWVDPASLTVTGDNLGNHTATTNLNMNSRDVNFTTGNQNMPTGNINFGNTTRQMLNLWGASFGIGIQTGTQYYRSNDNFAWFRGGTHNTGVFNAGGGVVAMTLNNSNTLDVNGNIRFDGIIYGNDQNALQTSDEWLRLNQSGDFANGVFTPSLLRADGGAIFNEDGLASNNFRVEGDTDGNLFNINASTNSIGIGVAVPSAKFDVNGTLLARNGLISSGIVGAQMEFGFAGTPQYKHAIKTRHNGGGDAGNAIDFYVWDQGVDAIGDEPTKRVLAIDGNGNNGTVHAYGDVGIGTATPSSRLQVVGRTTTTNLTMTAGASNGFVLQSDGAGNASWVSPTSLSVTGDNLGNHTATTNLDMNSRDINFTTGNQNMPSGNISFGNSTRQMLNLWGTNFGIGIQSGTQYFRSNAHFAWFRGGTHNSGTFDAGGGTIAMTLDNTNKLTVNGEVEIANNLRGNGKIALSTNDTWLRLNNLNQFTSGIYSPGSMRIDGGVIFNENSINVDFRVEGDNDQNLLHADASNDHVGIGTNVANSKLTVRDNNNNTNYTGNVQVDIAELSFRTTDFQIINPNYSFAMGGLGLYANYGSDFDRRKLGGVYGQIGSNQSGHLIFTTMLLGTESERMTITESGNVGIGTNAPSQRLHVAGNIFVTGTVSSSDSTLKTNIKRYEIGALAQIQALNPVTYNWKASAQETGGYSNDSQIGFLAQEMKEVIPEAVLGEEGKGMGIDYNKVVPVVVKAMQEQQKTIDAQQAQIDKLEAELQAIKTMLKK